jgi:hypothetical protein
MLDRATKDRAAAVERQRARARTRQRCLRERRRKGQLPYRVVVSECDVAEAMIRSGRLSADETLRRDLVELALAGVIGDWIQRWRAHSVTP